MQTPSAVTTFLFTDIEGSTRLWEQEPERMQAALARHDAIVRAAVERNDGQVVKMSGDGVHAAFGDPLNAVCAAVQLQEALADSVATNDVPLHVRCGVHAGVAERRDMDFFGSAVNRAARIMSVAHGGQVLLSQAVALLIGQRLPEDVALRDLGSIRLRDLSSPERIFQIVHARLRRDFPTLRSLEATPNNLPQQITSFVGRERELTDVSKLLRGARLLTLIGPGGIGKTRLSLQVAAEAMDDYPQGVWLVELAPLADARLVAQAVASVLGVKEEAGRPVVEALVKYAKHRRVLLILDNCEHLLDACADLAKQLLQSGPNLKIMASSREHLRVGGETIYPVPALATPDPDEKFIHTALTHYEAARLFVERAVAVQPTFEISEQNAPAIAEVCRRLDGIPLAIELAASRARALSVETIAARLGDRFRLLTGGDRTALPRQQTLRALIDWSYDLLAEDEKALFRRLAVCAGGWTLEAAEAIGVDGAIARADILGLLSNLVEKSLVAIDAEGGRYRLLDTVRQYALESLEDSGEEAGVRTRHLVFYLSLAESADEKLRGPEAARWLSKLDLDWENLLAAHAWCDHADAGAERGLRLIHALRFYLTSRGLLALGLRETVGALHRPLAQARNLARCRGLFFAGQLECFRGHYDEAKRYLEESLAIAREMGDKSRIAIVLQPLAMACSGLGDKATARFHLEEAVAKAQEQGNKRELAGALNGLAQLYRAEGMLDQANPLYEQVVLLARGLGDRESIAIGLLNLAMVAVERESLDQARALLRDVEAIVAETGSKRLGESVLEVSAGLAVMHCEWDRAARFFGAAEAQMRTMGFQRDPGDEAFLLPLIAKARTALGAAPFAAAEAAGNACSYGEAIADARRWLGRPAP